MMKAREVMTCDVIIVSPDTTVAEIARLLTEHRIGAVPVVDQENRVMGMVTENDLFLKEKGMPFSAVKLPMLFKQWVQPERLAQIYAEARHHTATDVMTLDPAVADVEDNIGHVAWEMATLDVDRVIVLREGRLAGIITRSDIIRLLAHEEE